MRRKELKKAISKYAKQVKFYRYGLISKYLKYQEKEKLRLINSIPKIKCPSCGNKKIDIEYSDCEYSSEEWLFCDICEEYFDDEVGYIDAVEGLNHLCWSDEIAARAYFDNDIDFNSLEWKEYCENKIINTLNYK